MVKKILFIDSDEAFASGLSQASAARGLSPFVSTNSEQGIGLAKQESPDLIVVCVEAQPTNGYMLCTRLKKDERLKGIPVILTSANATADSFEKHKKLKTRAEDYLIKPFQPVQLFEKVNRLLGLPQESGVHGDLHLLHDEPLGLGDLVAGDDEPIQISDHELQASSSGDDGFLVDEVEEVVQVDEQSSSADGDPDLQMFDRAFEALEMPGSRPDQHDATTPIAAPPAHADLQHDEVMHLSPEAAHEAKSGAPAAHPEKSIDDILGSLDSSAAEGDASSPTAQWEARLHEVEQELAARTAELEVARAQGGSSSDVLKLKEQRNKQDREILRLKDELQGKERELLDVQDAQTQLETQVQQQKDDAIKREAAAKALQQRAEALAAAAKKFERELSAAREELKSVQAVKARHAELEKAHLELRGRHEGAQSEIDKAQARLAEIKAELEGARDLHGSELAGARELHQNDVQQIRGELTVLQDDLRKAHDELVGARAETQTAQSEAQAAQADVQRLSGDLDTMRAELTAASGERELLREEREELRSKLAAAESVATQNEDRAVKAYGRIKNDERLRDRTRKALQIALQLLDEQPSLEAQGEHAAEAKQSA